MSGDIPEDRFVWQAEDDLMQTGDVAAPRGYMVLIDPLAEPEPGHTVLVQIRDRRPVLRLLQDAGDAYQLVVTSGHLDPVKLHDGEYQIIGVAVTSYREEITVKRRRPPKPRALEGELVED